MLCRDGSRPIPAGTYKILINEQMHNRKQTRLKGFDYSTKRYFYFTVIVKDHIHSFVIMPDHIHGIIFIDSDYYKKRPGIEILKIKPLSELIGAYKTTVSKQIHAHGDVDFKWQNSYHDHIIRNDWELIRIKRYINDNPANWLCKEGSRPFPT